MGWNLSEVLALHRARMKCLYRSEFRDETSGACHSNHSQFFYMRIGVSLLIKKIYKILKYIPKLFWCLKTVTKNNEKVNVFFTFSFFLEHKTIFKKHFFG